MKIATIFVLVALSTTFASATVGSKMHPFPKCDLELLKKNLAEVLKSVKDLLCSYQHCQKVKGTDNECSLEEWKAMVEKVNKALTTLGCNIDELLLKGHETVEEITAKVGDVLKKLEGPLRDILVGLGLEETLFEFTCEALGPLLVKLADLLEKLNLPSLPKLGLV
ncbi:uncharacterized protein LOC144821700 [Lissotriton helveticus]